VRYLYDHELLTALDEELNHQAPLPFRVPATSDHRFYDRHWFEIVDADQHIAAMIGLGIYKNMDVSDGFLTVQHEGQQHNLRFSRMLGNDLSATVGSLQIRIVEPFVKLHVVAGDPRSPIACDLAWTSTGAPHLEDPHMELRGHRVLTHTNRYDQLGSLSGWIRVGDRVFESENWWGVRDHSWGVRPDIGGFEATGGKRVGGVLWHWLFGSAGGKTVHLQAREDGAGRLQTLEGMVRSDSGQRNRIVSLDHDVKFTRGREWTQVTYRLGLDDGSQVSISAQPLVRPWAYRGTGYENGFSDSRGVGVVRGSVVEYDVLDISEPGGVTLEGEPFVPGHREVPARVAFGSDVGQAHIMVLSSGYVARYGLGTPPHGTSLHGAGAP
jgi:hypothetical protein